MDGKDMKLNNEPEVNTVSDIASILKQHAYRGDLQESNDNHLSAYGNTDIKTYSTSSRQFAIQSGPIFSIVSKSDEDVNDSIEVGAFEWEKFSDISHDEQPEAWKFPEVYVQYIWN